ncbi:MAG: 23S rRNA (pseudouridine(1915)-N(3))-methyltransferase RlmH [Alphaproteobacteria bacterium]|nr:23S rRNA (pseudouridine(1915)-N(3))-methyltransferase RlmH [Alphaproteobacteria bacterium]
MKLRLLTVGKGSTPWADTAVDDYGKRLRRFGGIEERTLKPEPFRGDVEAVRAAEADRILGAIGPRDRLVCLDERGEAPDTDAFAELLREGLEEGGGALVFAIGGPYGHGPAVRAQAWRVVRLSALVLNHQIARVVLYEQLYRAMTLLRGGSYHH